MKPIHEASSLENEVGDALERGLRDVGIYVKRRVELCDAAVRVCGRESLDRSSVVTV